VFLFDVVRGFNLGLSWVWGVW